MLGIEQGLMENLKNAKYGFCSLDITYLLEVIDTL